MDLNPGFLGISEIKIPVPWGHIVGKAWGNPNTGKPVLAVHGWMDNAGTFDTLIPLLSKSLYVVAIETPGQGLSSNLPPGIPYHYIDLITSIRRVVTYLKWTRFFWMGHSMGASLGVMYATIFPDEIDRLILLDLVRPITNPSDGCVPALKTGIFGFLLYDEAQIEENESPVCYPYDVALERLMLVMKYSHYPLTESAAKTLLIRGSRRVSEDEWTFTRDQRMMANSILRFSHEQFFDMMKELQCHVLMIKANEASWFQSIDIYQKAIVIYKKFCPSFKLVQIPGNHFVHLIHPNRISKHILDFFLTTCDS